MLKSRSSAMVKAMQSVLAIVTARCSVAIKKLSKPVAGDMIAFSSSKNGSTDRVKAIKVLAGVEPFIRMAQATSGGRRGQGVDGGFSIPGLDSIGGP